MGSLVTAPGSLLAKTTTATFDAYRDEVALITGGAAHHIGVYRTQSGPPKLHVVVAGLVHGVAFMAWSCVARHGAWRGRWRGATALT